MRSQLRWSLIAATLLAAGCSGSATQPSAPTTHPQSDSLLPSGTAALGAPVIDGDQAQSALGIYTVSLDPASLQATATLAAQRSGQQTDDLYGLEIGPFLRPDSLRVTGVIGTSETLAVSYEFSHPFTAPADLDAAATAKNRIDLGITGRVVFLVDSADPTADTFFDATGVGGGKVVAATNVIANADAYWAPAALVNLSGFSANTFPYKVLVDESQDPRTSQIDGSALSNGGSPLGNYDETTGWTRATIGANHDAWTGMGYLHQGQRTSSQVEIDRDALGSGPVSFDVAIIAKYGDPRGGTNATQKRANRLPATSADLAQFGYRAPHGSLDVESIRFVGESGGFLPNMVSASTLSFQVVDWDARATETSAADLSQDTASASNVAVGEAGAPLLAVCIPGVLGPASATVVLTGGPDDDDSGAGGDPEMDLGRPGDALHYSEAVSKSIPSGQVEGLFTGMVRATDVEDALGTPLMVWLDDALVPLTGNQPRPITYQVLQVLQDDLNSAPAMAMTTPPSVLSGTPTSMTVTSASDAEGDPITVMIDWDNDTVFEDTHVINAPYTTPLVYNSTVPKYNNTTLTPLPRTIPVKFSDGVMATPQSYAPALGFTLGANRAPVVTGTLALQDPTVFSPATFLLTAGTSVATDPEGDAVTLKVTNSVDATVATGVLPLNLGPYTNPPVTTVNFTTWATDALHPATGGGPSDGASWPVVVGTVQLPCTPTTPILTATFNSGSDGFTAGHLFFPQVFNSDNAPGDSRFWRCSTKTSQGFGSGQAWSTGPSWAGCGTNDSNYGAQCDNSTISPTFTLAGKTDARVVFNSSKNGRTGSVARYKIWVSTDNGASWVGSNIVYDTDKTASGILNESNVPVSLSAYAGLANLRLRFQFVDTTNSTYSVPSSQFAGWGIDEVRIQVCP